MSGEVTAEDLDTLEADGISGRGRRRALRPRVRCGGAAARHAGLVAGRRARRGRSDGRARDGDGSRRGRDDHHSPGDPGRRAGCARRLRARPPPPSSIRRAATSGRSPASRRFNPNAMTIGTTLGGVSRSLPPAKAQIFNKAVLAAYPAGSSFKPFTLLAALETGVVDAPATPVPCSGRPGNTVASRSTTTWTTPCRAGALAEAMAFSCNTTYMPLSIRVWDVRPDRADRPAQGVRLRRVRPASATWSTTPASCPTRALRENGRGGYSGVRADPARDRPGRFLGTPLQLANAYAAFGNGGTLWTPRIVTTATLPDGTDRRAGRSGVPPTTFAVDPADLAFLTDTLQAVVTLPYGTGTAPSPASGSPSPASAGRPSPAPRPACLVPGLRPGGRSEISRRDGPADIPLGTGGTDAAPLVRRVMAPHFFELKADHGAPALRHDLRDG